MVSLTLFEIGELSDPIRHDTTRPNYPPFFHSTAAIVSCTISLRFTLWTPRKG